MEIIFAFAKLKHTQGQNLKLGQSHRSVFVEKQCKNVLVFIDIWKQCSAKMYNLVLSYLRGVIDEPSQSLLLQTHAADLWKQLC